VKLYVCWNTNRKFMGSDSHPCGVAYEALKESGHSPMVIKGRGWRILPDAVFNRSEPRQEVKQLTGRVDVPVLITDEGEAIYPSQRIVEWANAHPARP
jgi:hypothetical protein